MTYTLEDYLLTLHIGDGWFGWSDSSNKVYANLILQDKISNGVNENNAPLLKDNPHSKPSESDCTAGVAALQTAYDALEYSRLRKAKYNLLNQDEMRYDDVKNTTTTWVDAIDAIKAAHPKP
jgi:hypothetical protein